MQALLRSWWGGWAAVVAVASVPAQVDPAPSASSAGSSQEQEWVRLRVLLEARDAAIASAYLPYSVVESIAGPESTDEPAAGAASHEAIETGWWALDHQRFAFLRKYEQDGEAEQVHFTWDGSRCAILSVRPALIEKPERDPGAFPALMEVHAHPAQPAKLAARHLPAEFGLTFAGSRWTDWSKAMADFRVLGRENVDGVDCLVVQFDLVGPGQEDDDEYLVPWVVWFDDRETLLARRRVNFTPDRDEPDQPRIGPSRMFGGKSFRPYSMWTLTEARQVNGFWIPAAGEYRRATRLGEQRLNSRIGEGATINDGLPDECFKLEPPPGTTLIDYVEGRNEKLSQGPGDAEVTLARQGVFTGSLRELERFALVDRVTAAPASGTHILDSMDDFGSSSCGPNALFLLLTFLGYEVSLASLVQDLPPAHRSMGKTNLKTLQDLAGSFAEARTIHDEVRDLPSWPSMPFVAHLSGEDHEHFAVACVMPVAPDRDQAVWVCSPPLPPSVLTIDEFQAMWSGMALVVGTNAGRWFDGRQRTATVRRASLLLGGVLCIAAGLTWRVLSPRFRSWRRGRAA